MRIMIDFRITKEALHMAAIDVERLEKAQASRRLADEMDKHFPSTKIDKQERLERGIPPYDPCEYYENEVHVYTRKELQQMMESLKVLGGTRSQVATYHLEKITNILIG